MSCSKCSRLRSAIRASSRVETSSSYPSTLELAYMVNLEYSAKIGLYNCVHAIPETDGAKISVREMTDFLDDKKWELSGKTSYEGFSCANFVNKPAKQLVIVHRGTENLKQVKADIQMAFKIFTDEVFQKADWHTYHGLMNYALEERDNKFVRNGFSVTIAGHSLGGWLAQVCTLICKNPKFLPKGPRGTLTFGGVKTLDLDQPFDLHCVAFDSPGARSVLKQLEQESRGSSNAQEMMATIQDLDITIYLSNSNLVNMCDYHVGSPNRIDVMADESFWRRLNPIASHSMERIVEYFKKNP